MITLTLPVAVLSAWLFSFSILSSVHVIPRISCSPTSPLLLPQFDSRVGPSYRFYDQGVELTDEGLYGHHGYTRHATRGTLSLHSLYLLLWANFAAFCTALLFHSEAEDKLVGSVFSEGVEPVRQYCVSQLRQLWGHLRNSLTISDEERLLLVGGCLNQLFEV